MDLYHCQIAEGDVATRLRQYLPTGRVAHLQIAGVPERQEPDRGELHYPYLFELIDALGYTGWIGCEYRPRGATRRRHHAGPGLARPCAPGPTPGDHIGTRDCVREFVNQCNKQTRLESVRTPCITPRGV